MTTVAEFIEFLKTQPQDAEVECVVEYVSGWNVATKESPVDLDDCTLYDFTNMNDKNSSLYGRKILVIHGEE